MRNLLLSIALIALPASGFALVEHFLPSAAVAPAAGLGDLSAYARIVTDTQALADAGDMTGAEHRITDLETLWDANEPTLSPADPAAWGAVDGAADAVFAALRTNTPDPAQVRTSLAALAQVLAHPVAQGGAMQQVAGIAVTDAGGHPLPCETMIARLRDALGTGAVPPAVADLQARALERCNADDDSRADAFVAQALAHLN